MPSGSSNGILSVCLPISTAVHSSAYGTLATQTCHGMCPVAL